MSSPTIHAPAWTIIVPVKQTTIAKSRLSGFDAPTRQRLAVAFAQDTVTAALGCPEVRRVCVVTDDPAGLLLRDLGADLIPDAPNAGLNAALHHAAQQIRDDDSSTSVAALSADLPALRAGDLTAAIRSVTAPRWFVPDLAGDGTTMLAAASGHRFAPQFGPDSRARHRALGMVEVDIAGLERLRRDVDTVADLTDARRRGIGPYTALVLDELGDLSDIDERRPA
jgi:2-phospho-L-lactate/phosphoenolpyruvate guanylyltransferase